MAVHVIPLWIKNPYDCPEVSTVSNSGEWSRLSPFLLPAPPAKNLENLWQYSKVYRQYADALNNPTSDFYKWREKGFNDALAHRYPMGKGARPLYSLWAGKRLSYVEARKAIYAPEYAKNVILTDSYTRLVYLYQQAGEITLKDYDAYDHIVMNMSLIDVINNPDKKMGHAFVLAMMLEDKLEKCLTPQ